MGHYWTVAESFNYVLFPGRHHVLTRFQARYLTDLLGGWLADAHGEPLPVTPDAVVVWAVTSANHQNTRRNPIPANRREAAIELFSFREGIPSLVAPVVDSPATDRFADITLKSVTHSTGGKLVLTPDNAVLACSTPAVAELYKQLGFRVAPVEHGHPENPLCPWQVLELLAEGDHTWRRYAHPATLDLYDRYGLDDQVRMISADPIVGSEGSLTDTRNYRTYSASFEAAGDRKWTQARPFVRPGRIVDIGCATGAMLERAAAEPELAESDLFGIELARHLYEECVHKKAQGAFANANTFFYQRNILADAVFPDASIDTTLTFALTHEIYSYAGGIDALRHFVTSIAAHTAPGGVWINSDVCGPSDGDQPVHLLFHTAGVDRPSADLSRVPPSEVRPFLETLNPAERFPQFAEDFRRNAGTPFVYEVIDPHTVRLRLADAMEFLSKVGYVDNWLSETHEQFCALSWADWTALVRQAGLEVDPRSGPWRNEWVVEHSYAAAARLTTPAGDAVDWPDTHLLLVATRSPQG